jgi:hypothetical protein
LARNHLFVVVVHVRREAEVTDLDVAGVAVHENVVALEIACALQRLQATTQAVKKIQLNPTPVKLLHAHDGCSGTGAGRCGLGQAVADQE